MHNATVPIRLCLLGASLLSSISVWAETSQSSPVVVTATRTAQSADESLTSVTVITREQIDKSGARDVMELLRLESGIDMARSGGPGQATSLFMRGTNSNHVLVLIDGVRAASATTGAFAWAQMSASQIERIEIVRGPRASLYGSDAIGGVINIFTRKPQELTAGIEAGSYGTTNINAGLATGKKRRFTLNAENRSTDGFSAQNEKGSDFNPDDDGYDNTSVTASLLYPLGDDISFKFDGWVSDGETEFDQGVTDSQNETFGLTIKTHSTDTWSHVFRAGYAKDDLDTRSAFPSAILTRRRTVEWQNDITVGNDSLLTLGLSYIRDMARNTDNSVDVIVFDKGTTDKAVFADWQSAYNTNDYQLSMRFDNHDTFGNETTGNLAWGRNVHKNIRLLASYGTAFRAPTINELYHPGFGGFFAGNPNLEPETSQTLEFGARFDLPADSRLELNLYDTRIDKLIVFEGINSQAINLDKADIKGLEVSHTLTDGPWSYKTGLTLQNARNSTTDTELLRRPDRKLAVRIRRDFGTLAYMGLELLASSERKDVGNITLPGYGVVNLNIGYRLGSELGVEARMENILDKEYELVSGYNTPGASAYIGLRYTHQ